MPEAIQTAAKPPVVPGKVRLAILMGGTAAALLTSTIQKSESDGRKHNVAYLDPVGIPTAGDGITGHGIIAGHWYSDQQLDEWFYEEALSKVTAVSKCTPSIKGKGKLLVASGDLAYNAGIATWCKSSMSRLMNAGQFRAACDRFPLYKFAGGRVLPGLVARRAKERAICIQGATEL
jgi:lysozyme